MIQSDLYDNVNPRTENEYDETGDNKIRMTHIPKKIKNQIV